MREGVWIKQPVDQPVDIANWRGDAIYSVYPVGTRDKSLLHCPDPSPFSFLLPGHRYLFKHAFHRHPDQFWAEIISYRIGSLLGQTPVPPAFIAYDSDTGDCGALIEWFLGHPSQPEERFVHGGEIMMDLIPDFDRKTGRQHNFHALELYLNQLTRNKNLGDDWSTYFCKLFLFDALIGNTDRHQDNWGLLWRQIEGRANARLAPAFDNGTSLGYEIMEHKMVDFKREERILQYINRGKHHIRWRLHDQKSAAHAELIRLIIQQKPFLKDTVQKLLSSFHMEKFESSLKQMTQFDIPVPLTATRAEWVYSLVGARHKHLQKQLLTA